MQPLLLVGPVAVQELGTATSPAPSPSMPSSGINTSLVVMGADAANFTGQQIEDEYRQVLATVGLRSYWQ